MRKGGDLLRANPDAGCADLVKRLRHAIDAHARGARCQCGESIWIIGSAEVGFSCFTCITGESGPDRDYEIVTDDTQPPSPTGREERAANGAPLTSSLLCGA